MLIFHFIFEITSQKMRAKLRKKLLKFNVCIKSSERDQRVYILKHGANIIICIFSRAPRASASGRTADGLAVPFKTRIPAASAPDRWKFAILRLLRCKLATRRAEAAAAKLVGTARPERCGIRRHPRHTGRAVNRPVRCLMHLTAGFSHLTAKAETGNYFSRIV